jgi:dihydroorotase
MKSISTLVSSCAAGIYTSPILLPLVAHLLEEFGALDRLEGFVSTFGRAFYKVEGREGNVTLRKVEGRKVEERWELEGESVVPFWAGKKLGWEIVENGMRK